VRIGALIVDDQADVRLLIRLVIEDADHGLFVAGEAGSGQEAVDRVGRCDPEVVVLDAMMPGLDGFETAARIRRRRPEQPIILCSAHVDEELQRKAQKLGIAACLSKGEFEQIPRAMVEAASAGAGGRT
jgi:CheY-like chemotaxis protein